MLLLIIAAAVIWRLHLWSRAPHDAPTRSVALSLLSAGLSYPVAMPGGTTGIDTVAGHGTAKLVQNVLLLLTVYFLMCFYLYSADGQAARRRARWEAVVVAAVMATIILAAVNVPHEALAGSFSTADMTIPQVAFFYTGAGLYLMYALGAAGRWSARYARMSRRPHATGLWMTAIGLGAMAAACAVRAVFVAVRWSGGSVSHQLTTSVAVGLVVSSLLFVAGITYSGVRARITATRLWLRRRRDHRRLIPLWQLLIEVYPENELRPASRGLWDRWRARGVHRRYHRRIVECRDGLVDISPYLVRGEDGTGLLDLDPTQLARRLRSAATMIKNGVPAPGQAVALAVPQEDDRNADVRQLIAVSEALRLTA
ncbi:MAB_1171c family putative transporter [Streptomyces sp. ATCC 21386]|uniref:MAB_1171c family putative transporter n=1 Tax=Streptomyces sp. ATCC 21386 TaxID=2699428 RepID=UPI001BFF10A0|nr:MAB_1171c family putative transporter [Streptomyces sp. ATCC 21386]